MRVTITSVTPLDVRLFAECVDERGETCFTDVVFTPTADDLDTLQRIAARVRRELLKQELAAVRGRVDALMEGFIDR